MLWNSGAVRRRRGSTARFCRGSRGAVRRHDGAKSPPARGVLRGRRVCVAGGRCNPWNMESDTQIRDADLELLLAESDREEPFLVSPRRPEPEEPREEIDARILAGLVTP